MLKLFIPQENTIKSQWDTTTELLEWLLKKKSSHSNGCIVVSHCDLMGLFDNLCQPVLTKFSSTWNSQTMLMRMCIKHLIWKNMYFLKS